MLRILQKHYGGIDWFEDKPVILLSQCLLNGIDKELEIPKLIKKVFDTLQNKPVFEDIKGRNNMRSAEDIMKDYGLGGALNG